MSNSPTDSAKKLYIPFREGSTRWGVGRTSLYKAINGKLPGTEHIPPIQVIKFGAATLIHVPSGDFFFSQLPRYAGASREASSEVS